MFRLGIGPRILGRAALRRQTEPREGEPGPQASQLLQLRDALGYLGGLGVGGYRLPDTLAADGAQPDAALGAALGAQASACGIRLSFHPGLHAALAAPDAAVAEAALAEVERCAALLDALSAADGVIVLHVGGAQGGHEAALARFAARHAALSARARRYVAVEADDHSFDIAALLWLARTCRAPLIFDSLHFQLHNPQRLRLDEALGLAFATWPAGRRPKIHLSTQRTEAHLRPGRGGRGDQIIPPRRGQHADFLNPFEVAALLRQAHGIGQFDIMIEAKAADLALLRLRDDLRTLAPEVAALEEPPHV